MVIDGGGDIAGLDVGDSWVGVALADRSGSLASPLMTLSRKSGQAEKELLKLISDSNIKIVVAGLPLSEDNSENEQCDKIRRFMRRLERRISIEIVFIDEYGSSLEACEKLFESKGTVMGMKKSGAVDAVSAALILQKYLDSKSGRV